MFTASLLVVLLAAQQSSDPPGAGGGGVRGQVTDTSGAVIADARVVATAAALGDTRETFTDEDGKYRVRQLAPGVWRLSIEREGLAPARREARVRSGREVVVDVVLGIPTMNERVTVSGTTTDRLAIRRFGDPGLTELVALRGRSALEAARLAAPVVNGRENVGGGAFKEPDTGAGSSALSRLSLGGQSEISTQVLVDGLDATQTFTGLPRAVPPQSAVDEVRLLHAVPPAEYGRALGGVISVLTRSPGADWGGDAQWLGMHESLAARSLLTRNDADRLRHQQFGATIGGTLPRFGVSLFGAYEGQTRTESNRFSQVILSNLTSINDGRAALGLSPESIEQLRTHSSNGVFVRVDRAAGASGRLSIRYNWLGSHTDNVPGGAGRASPAPSTARTHAVDDHTLAASLNLARAEWLAVEIRGQLARRRFDFASVRKEPTLEIANLLIMGKTSSDPDFYRERRAQAAATATVTRGTHLVKIGADVQQLADRSRWELFFPARIVFPSLDAFAAGQPSAFWWSQLAGSSQYPGVDVGWTQAVPPAWDPLTSFEVSHAGLAMFAQHEWQIRRSLTMTVGLRYDIESYPSEFLASRDADNLQPRVTLSWRADDATVIQAGYGLLFDRLAASVGQMLNTTAWNSRGYLDSAPMLFPTVARVEGRFLPLSVRGATAPPAMRAFFATGRTPPAAAGIAAFSDNLNARVDTPHSHHAMVAIARELGRAAIGATYFTVHGRGILLHTPNLNAEQTGILPGGKPVVAARRIPELGDFFVQDGIGESRYHGLTLDGRVRSGQNPSFRAAYTWARARSNGDSLANLADLPEGPSLPAEWALSRQHVGHRFTAAATAAAPERWRLVSGLRLTGIATLESGRRFTVFAGSDVNGDGNPNSDRPGTLPRNSLEGPGYAAIDFRLAKRMRISETAGLEATVDVFNALNRANVRDLNTVWGSGDLSRTPPAQFAFGTARDVFNPRQVQIGIRLEFP